MRPQIVLQAEGIARGVKRCFVCRAYAGDCAKLSNPRSGRRVSVCPACIAGQPWSLKAQAAPDDAMLLYLERYAPLYALFPAHVARCLTGHHKHSKRMPHPCLEDWRVMVSVAGPRGETVSNHDV